MKIIIEEKDLDSLEVKLTSTHRWVKSDGFFEVKAELINIPFLHQWFEVNKSVQIYLGTNYYNNQEDEDNQYSLGLPRIITMREFIDWHTSYEFQNTLESLNKKILGDIENIQISLKDNES